MKMIPLISWAARIGCATLIALGAAHAAADTAIETETAQIGKLGEWNFSQSYEYEAATDGSSEGTLTQYEYGISDRSEILIEPFFYVKESPDGSPSQHGAGDLEITPSYMVVVEEGNVPAILLAFKIKVPTGDTNVGGTGVYDYYPYLIFGEHRWGWTFNQNLGVNFAGRPSASGYDKATVWDLEAEREVLPKLTLFFEAFSAEDSVKTASMSAEYQFTDRFNAFIVASRTEEQSNVIRIGFNYGY